MRTLPLCSTVGVRRYTALGILCSVFISLPFYNKSPMHDFYDFIHIVPLILRLRRDNESPLFCHVSMFVDGISCFHTKPTLVMNDLSCKNGIIPNVASPMGVRSLHYDQKCLGPLFGGSQTRPKHTSLIPLQTKVWEALSNYCYDYVLSNAGQVTGKAADLTGIPGR